MLWINSLQLQLVHSHKNDKTYTLAAWNYFAFWLNIEQRSSGLEICICKHVRHRSGLQAQYLSLCSTEVMCACRNECLPFSILCVDIQLNFITNIDGLVQDCNNSSALVMELLQSCTKPSILAWKLFVNWQILANEVTDEGAHRDIFFCCVAWWWCNNSAVSNEGCDGWEMEIHVSVVSWLLSTVERPIYHDITCSTVLTAAGHDSDLKLTAYTRGSKNSFRPPYFLIGLLPLSPLGWRGIVVMVRAGGRVAGRAAAKLEEPISL